MKRQGKILSIGLVAVLMLLLPSAASALPEPPAPTITDPHFSESCYNADDLDAGFIDDADPDTVDNGDSPFIARGTVNVVAPGAATSVELYEIPPAPAPAVLIGTDVTLAGGVWDIPLTAAQLTDGYHLLHAIAVNALGVMRSLPGALVYCVDTMAPGAPTFLGPVDAMPGDFTSCVTNPFVISGTAEPNATVYVEEQPAGAINGSSLWYTRADSSGAWSVNAHHDDIAGDHTVTVMVYQRDGGRNQSAAVGPFVFDVCDDVTPPPAPVITAPSPGGLPEDATVLITGTATPDPCGTLRVFVREHSASPDVFADFEATVDQGTGNWQLLQTFPSSGIVTFRAYAVDCAGNKSLFSASVVKMIDADIPAVRINLPSGFILGDPWILSSPTFTGIARDNYGLDHIEIDYDALFLGSSTSTPSAVAVGCPTDYDDVADPNDSFDQEAECSWSDAPTLAPGLYEMRVRSVDLAGNISEEDTMFVLIVDAP